MTAILALILLLACTLIGSVFLVLLAAKMRQERKMRSDRYAEDHSHDKEQQ